MDVEKRPRFVASTFAPGVPGHSLQAEEKMR